MDTGVFFLQKVKWNNTNCLNLHNANLFSPDAFRFDSFGMKKKKTKQEANEDNDAGLH